MSELASPSRHTKPQERSHDSAMGSVLVVGKSMVTVRRMTFKTTDEYNIVLISISRSMKKHATTEVR